VTFSTATTYWVQRRGTGACSATTSGGVTSTIAVYPAFSPGTITTASTTTTDGTNPGVTIANATPASGGNGSITYQWRRTGTSSTTFTGSNAATYTIGTDATNYATAGTYYFNRYAHDGACNTAWVAATGTYTLYVDMATTLCPQCCYDGAAWVDCQVTTKSVAPTSVVWSGNGNTFYSGASGVDADKNGRVNTAAIDASTTTLNAVQLCKNLGEGWYLPAYEELVNMSKGEGIYSGIKFPPLNGRPGAYLLPTNTVFWSSTELIGTPGRFAGAATGTAVVVDDSGGINATAKTQYRLVVCAWRN
jgi:hypothetical protein